MNIKKMLKNKKGFTLIEIIVVIVILAVLLAVAVPSVLNYLNEADDAKYMAQARGAYISYQAEVVKAWTTKESSAPVTLEKAHENTLEVLKGTTPEVKTVVAMVNTTEYKISDNPNEISSYIVTFKDGKIATLTPNGSIVITGEKKPTAD